MNDKNALKAKLSSIGEETNEKAKTNGKSLVFPYAAGIPFSSLSKKELFSAIFMSRLLPEMQPGDEDCDLFSKANLAIDAAQALLLALEARK